MLARERRIAKQKKDNQKVAVSNYRVTSYFSSASKQRYFYLFIYLFIYSFLLHANFTHKCIYSPSYVLGFILA